MYPLTAEEYGKALDNLVIGCVDVAVIHDGQILLEKRSANPIRGEWWILGGRINKGEELTDTARRKIEQEIGLHVEDKTRFVELGTYNLRWPTRAEPLSNNGCHHLLIAHKIELNDAEKAVVDSFLDNAESTIEWHDIKKSERFVPEMNSIIDDLVKSR